MVLVNCELIHGNAVGPVVFQGFATPEAESKEIVGTGECGRRKQNSELISRTKVCYSFVLLELVEGDRQRPRVRATGYKCEIGKMRLVSFARLWLPESWRAACC